MPGRYAYTVIHGHDGTQHSCNNARRLLSAEGAERAYLSAVVSSTARPYPLTMVTATPKLRVAGACELLGRDEVVGRCAALLSGGDVDPEFVMLLGGAPARRLLAAGVPADQQYWLRVWAVRGLLWSGPSAPSVRHALRDDHWRVREMACKVAARHLMDDLIDEVMACESDNNPRVAAAATRAVRRIATSAPGAG